MDANGQAVELVGEGYTDDWRPRLMELRELRQAHIAELDVLSRIEPKTEYVTEIITEHGENIASISNEIAELLAKVRVGADT
jgi:hypothetical protein